MIKHLKTFLIMISFLLTTTLNGFAYEQTPSNVVLLGDKDGISFSDESSVFFNLQNMTPGDSQTKTITIKSDLSSTYELYMKAQRVTDKTENDLLSKINLNLIMDGKTIYDNEPVSGEDGLVKDIKLGDIKSKSEHTLIATVTLDGKTTGNEYQNKGGIVNWIFTATNLDEVDGDNDNNNSNSSNNSSSTKPPQTGDQSIGMYILLGAGSILLLMIFAKKNKNETK